MRKRFELLSELQAAGFQTLSVKELEALNHINPKRFILGVKLEVELGVLIYCLGSGRCEGIAFYFLRRANPAINLNEEFKLGVLGRHVQFGETVVTLQDLISLG